MEALLEALKYQDIKMLRQKASELKQTDGEGWAVGKMVERACESLECANPGSVPMPM